MTITTITCFDAMIDSRDIIDRIEELEDDMENLTEEEKDELTNLKDLADDASDYSDNWDYGAILIRDSYFEEYAKGFAEDIGAMRKNDAWPYNHIDWKAAANELKKDYTEVEFDGVSYWVC